MKNVADLLSRHLSARVDVKLEKALGLLVVQNLRHRILPKMEGHVARLNRRDCCQTFVELRLFHVIDTGLIQRRHLDVGDELLDEIGHCGLVALFGTRYRLNT